MSLDYYSNEFKVISESFQYRSLGRDNMEVKIKNDKYFVPRPDARAILLNGIKKVVFGKIVQISFDEQLIVMKSIEEHLPFVANYNRAYEKLGQNGG